MSLQDTNEDKDTAIIELVGIIHRTIDRAAKVSKELEAARMLIEVQQKEAHELQTRIDKAQSHDYQLSKWQTSYTQLEEKTRNDLASCNREWAELLEREKRKVKQLESEKRVSDNYYISETLVSQRLSARVKELEELLSKIKSDKD